MDFLDDFVAATDHLPSPRIFRFWTALVVVAAVMGRRVFARFYEDDEDRFTFANLFVVLVADAAGGKSVAYQKARKLLLAFEDVKFSHDMDSPENLMKMMADQFGENPPIKSFNIASDEIAMLLNDPEKTWWYQALAALWDGDHEVSKGTKTQDTNTILNPYVNLLGGGQPYWFAKGFPAGLNHLGLPSRILFIYADGNEMPRINLRAKRDREAWDRAQRSIARIARASGELKVTDEVQDAIDAWIDGGYQPHVNLEGMSKGYAHRRLHHLCKLCMIVALVAHPDRMVIELPDFQRAFTLLTEAEQKMYKAMAFIGTTASYPMELEAVEFVRQVFEETGQGVAAPKLRAHIGRSFPASQRELVLEHLVQTGQLKFERANGGLTYIPGETP